MNKATGLDRLDFLLIFEAILEQKTITRAADRLGISQSALSHALTRLRGKFNDPLFVRTGTTMQPTPLVIGLSEPLQRSMAIVRNEIMSAAQFDPATTTRTFKLCVNEVGAFLLAPKVIRMLQKSAPHASLTPLEIPRADISGALESGRVDLAIGHYPELKTGIYQQLLFRRSYVAIVRRNHPYIGASMTDRQFFQTPLIRCTATVAISQWLDHRFTVAGQPQIIALETPYVMALATLAVATDWMAFVPEELVTALKNIAAVKVVNVPHKPPVLDLKQHWHRRFKDDGANKFLRQIVHQALYE
ncbi:MAG: LysR family transcriptional regulator [Polaromonas sp.]|uniref:LysR family transcriptional regulator n=1 Tax=Polaromonas sp. TaxID=1869339 RepID=UPI0025D583B6|nr:LysR family transcriptional regulator [Polaromonas sp.]MBI2725363.1 LysR family transcriptional regulator [Polaromonas sp.]